VASYRRNPGVDLGRHLSLAHQASARLNTLAAKAPPCLSLLARRGAEALAGYRLSRLWAGIIGHEVSKAALEQKSDLGADAARARNHPAGRPRAALAVEGSERRWNL
jgi:hypothetical protein